MFWRMGVGRMSIFLDGEDDFAMREIALGRINTYKEPEVLVNEISLEEFARLKRFVLDESLEAGGISLPCRWSMSSCRRSFGRGRGDIPRLGGILRSSWICLRLRAIRTMISGTICVRRKMNKSLSWSFV